MPTVTDDPVAFQKAEDKPWIFISYRRDDIAGHAGRLRDALVHRFGAASVFKDIESLKPGDDFWTVVGATIRTARVVLVLIGPRWPGPRVLRRPKLFDPLDWVRREILLAKQAGVRLVPILLSSARPPRAGSLPIPLSFLARTHVLEMRDERWHSDFADLVETLQLQPSLRSAEPLPEQSEQSLPRSAGRRHWSVLLGSLGFLIAVVALSIVPRHRTLHLERLVALQRLAVASVPLPRPAVPVPPPPPSGSGNGSASPMPVAVARQRPGATPTSSATAAKPDGVGRNTLMIRQARKGDVKEISRNYPTGTWVGKQECDAFERVEGKWKCVEVRVHFVNQGGLGKPWSVSEEYCVRSPATLLDDPIFQVQAVCERTDDPLGAPQTTAPGSGQ